MGDALLGKWLSRIAFMLAIGLAALLPGAARAQSFQGLGFLPGDTSSEAFGVSSNGSVVVGSGTTDGFVWTATGGLTSLGTLTPATGSHADAISGDGSTVAGELTGPQQRPTFPDGINTAARWTAATGWVALGPLSTFSEASGVNANGSVIVGNTFVSGLQQSFQWTAATGIVILPALPGYDSGIATGVSADGTVIVGGDVSSTLTEQAYRYTVSTGMVGLGFLPGDNNSFAAAVSADGSVVVGDSGISTIIGSGQAVRWTAATGMVGLGFLPGDNTSQATGTNSNGSVVVGYSEVASQPPNYHAFLWDQIYGMQNLQQILVSEYGLNLQGWTSLLNPNSGGLISISADGSTIVGSGTDPDGNMQAYRITGLLTNTLVTGTYAVAAGTTSQIGMLGGSGTVQIGAGGSLSVAGNNTSSDPVNFPNSVFSGTVTGAGDLIKAGSGLWLFSGSFQSSGNLFVNDGTFALGAANAFVNTAPITVASGATLNLAGFNQTIGSLSNSGMVTPGSSTLTLGGNYTQGSSGTLTIAVTPSSASKLAVGGAASLGGTLALDFAPGTYTLGTAYTLLTSASLTGTFSTVTGTNPSGLPQTILYEQTNLDPSVVLLLGQATVAPTNDTIYSAATSIAVMNAQQVNGIILDRIGQRQAGIADGQIAALTPGGITGTQLAQAGGGNGAALGTIAGALPDALAWQGMWFRGIGGFASVNGNSTAPGFTGSTGGFLAGYDRAVTPNTYLGIAGGYLHSNIDEHSTSNGTEGSARLDVYGGMMTGGGLFAATAGYASDRFVTNRGIAGMGTASENHSGNEGTAAGQWSLPLTIAGYGGGAATLTPKAGIQYLYLSEGAFSEAGASGFDLSNSGHGTNSLQPYVGAALAQQFITDGGTEITPELRLGYAYEVFDSRLLTVTSVGGAAFPVEGVKPSRDQLTAGLGLVMQAAPNLSVYGDYDTIVHTGNTTEQTIQAGLRWRF